MPLGSPLPDILAWHARARRYVRWRRVAWEDLEDLVQEMTVYALARPTQVLSVALAYQRALDQLYPRRPLHKHRQREQRAPAAAQAALARVAAPGPTLDVPVLVQQLLATLPPRTQRILRAYVWEGRRVPEIARAHALSTSRLSHVLHDALRALRTTCWQQALEDTP